MEDRLESFYIKIMVLTTMSKGYRLWVVGCKLNFKPIECTWTLVSVHRTLYSRLTVYIVTEDKNSYINFCLVLYLGNTF